MKVAFHVNHPILALHDMTSMYTCLCATIMANTYPMKGIVKCNLYTLTRNSKN